MELICLPVNIGVGFYPQADLLAAIFCGKEVQVFPDALVFQPEVHAAPYFTGDEILDFMLRRNLALFRAGVIELRQDQDRGGEPLLPVH